MRLWSLHPQLLDLRTLNACWRDALLAQGALRGDVRGFRQHPQLARFRRLSDPVGGVARYLKKLADEGDARGVVLNRLDIVDALPNSERAVVTSEQLDHEWNLYLTRVEATDKSWWAAVRSQQPTASPALSLTEGPVALWEATPTSRRDAVS